MSAPSSSLIRAAIFVADMDRAARFYAALGLDDTYYAGTLDAASVADTLAVPLSTVTRCRIVKRRGAANFGMIGLFELKNPAPPALPAARDAAPRNGEAALVFYVADMDDAMARLTAAGASAVGAVTTFRSPHRSQREACLRDPDGLLVNLIERDPDEQFATAPVA